MTDRPVARLLVTGATGQLGRGVVEVARQRGLEVAGLARTAQPPCDLRDERAVRARIASAAPDAIIHAAAWTDVDGCERDPALALAVNAAGTAAVARAADDVGARVIFLSTDHVFSGDQPDPYREADPTDPRSAYGRSKAAAEEVLGDGHAIVRTSWLAGRHGRSFVRTVVERARSGEALRVVDDQIGHPTFVADLAPVLVELAVRRARGTFHATNAGVVSWWELAREAVAAAGLDPEQVVPIRTAELVPARPAPRPANAVLADTRLHEVGIGPLPHFGASLRSLVAAIAEEQGSPPPPG